MNRDRIARDPSVMLGKPVVKGTRISVELILRKFAAGQSAAEILNDYPHAPPANNASWPGLSRPPKITMTGGAHGSPAQGRG
jgi:hypothetical protein